MTEHVDKITIASEIERAEKELTHEVSKIVGEKVQIKLTTLYEKLVNKSKEKYKYKIVAMAEGHSEGHFECTKEEFEIIKKAVESLGNNSESEYAPTVYVDTIE